MNDDLFQRFLSGDPHAATGVRNHLRAVAHRVLQAPQWIIDESEKRRERETAAVAEVMRSPGNSMIQAASKAMTVACRIGIEHLRQQDGVPSSHISADTLAKKAMDRLNEEEEEPLRQYLESCSTCSLHLEQARNALKAAISAQSAAPPPKPSTASPGPGQFRTATPSRKRRPNRKRHPKLSKGPGLQFSEVTTRLLLLFALGYGIFLATRPSSEEVLSAEWAARANLLPAELPPTSQARSLEPNIASAVQLMESGRCDDSRSRMARFVERDPENRLLRYYYSLSLLCIRKADEALQSFSTLKDMDGTPYWGEKWWYSQALYLGGGEDKALTLLDQIASSEHGRAADAEALIARIIEAQ